ncbi:hypothetical protein [Clostridium paraputrificum]|uniref:hypothetical protein n=1 Tax=Clostridium paraputrificum TaxID=29363 RepID=UPI000415B02D|nr:hypothetical protein [Clostridium paraputrificum]
MINLESKKARYTLKNINKIAKIFNVSVNQEGLEKKLRKEIEYYYNKRQDINNVRYQYQHDTRSPREFVEEILTNNELEEILKVIMKNNNNVQALHRLGKSKPATTKEETYKVNVLPDYLIIDKNKRAYTLELQCGDLTKNSIFIKKHKINDSNDINYLLLLDTYHNKYCLINPLEVDKSNFIKSIPNLGNKAGFKIPLNQDNIFNFNKECFNVLDAINYKCFANA